VCPLVEVAGRVEAEFGDNKQYTIIHRRYKKNIQKQTSAALAVLFGKPDSEIIH
jgi:hypothetical protein